ncbi:MAG: tyrosine--tRNA ligase [Candidatus Terrybacteria bacterium CG10_big_fil_rev_8_21_14_0_10_41_10]|uniref:Tyrosine--tRNA ligase n=1 Tax=Candidatus Terrybacteria bacterium CG10_big_fil_rev_8_21_14_0_10_41_10 TaxID=1975026 RepID=A0A2M8LAH6_9BACT|nr:MAG: tyrosine--tRNA ligase [Candidatus Terrybacteria bacterium CG10_big_fil_rev_8_21_14_0_10_41_10]
MLKADKNKIKEILERGVGEIIDKESLVKKLESGKELRVKFGVDPTSPNIHLGRTVPLLKLRDFQELGHKIVFIIGDFTGIIGDTSDKDSERPMLSEEKVEENMASYAKQAGKIIDLDKCEVLYNSQWLSLLGFKEIGKQADAFSVNEFISRDNIRKRLNEGKRVSLREVLYPLMQGYDSVHVKADVEVGGTDQRFNILAGRELQRQYGQEPQDIIMNPLIEGLDGRKMSSSWGNTVNLLDTPNDMYGKIMSLGDELIIKYFIFATRVSLEEVEGYKKEIENGVNPRDIKMKLASEIVKFYHSDEEAKKAEDYFIKTFSKKEIPDEMPEFKPSAYDVISILMESGLAASKAEARRNMEQNGIKINGQITTDPKTEVKIGDVIQKGKRYFVRVM